jgi:hypothetical protein
MNHYGAQAMRHWRSHLPTRFAQITDPETFFTDLGEQVETEVEGFVELREHGTRQRPVDDLPPPTGDGATRLAAAYTSALVRDILAEAS